MSHPQDMIDQYPGQARRARALSPEVRFLLGAVLFDLACQVTRDGIRYQHPDADESQVQQILRRRLALARRMETGK